MTKGRGRGYFADCHARNRGGCAGPVSDASPGAVEQGRLIPRVAALLLAAAVAAGCGAARRSPWVQSPGAGPIDVTVEALRLPASAATRAEQKAAASRAIAAAVRPERPKLLDAESTDARLRDALAGLASKPTAAAHLSVAREYHRLKVFDDAISHFDSAVALERRNASAFEGRARVWRDTGLLAQALADANRAIYFAPDAAAPRNTLGTILEALGQFDQARLAYERALTLDPGAGYAEVNLRELPLRMATRGPRRTP